MQQTANIQCNYCKFTIQLVAQTGRAYCKDCMKWSGWPEDENVSL